MTAQIRWDPGDSAGERTLAGVNDLGRFNRWKINSATIGERAVGWGTGITYQWPGRVDYLASWSLTVAYSDMSLVSEFLEWANAGNPFAIDTDDAASRTYEACSIAPDTLIECSEPDPETLDLTLTGTALNIAAVPVPMICNY